MVILLIAPLQRVYAADGDYTQQQVFQLGIPTYDVDGSGDSCGASDDTSGGGSTTGGGSSGGFSLDQVKTFASEPITSTWNISDSTAEQWFLKQPGARATVGKYGLNSKNIGDITSAIKAAGVSPVFFYAYTVNEGGGAGGFINHYNGDTGGGGVGNAKRDAEYLATQSKIMTSSPSWVDAGNPVDFVPSDVKTAGDADFKKFPSGTIGRAYIPATAATTWEVYYPNGLKQEYNKVQNYGTPLNNTMQGIKKIGGDPLQGGASISTDGCPTGVLGEGMAKGISFAKFIASDDGYGYDESSGRTTGWAKYQSDPTCAHDCGSFDCSSFVSAILTVAGYFKDNPEFSTSNETSELEQHGFKKIADSAHTDKGLQPGDILWVNSSANQHTEMYIGDGKDVRASGDYDGKVGDGNGEEIQVVPFNDDSWMGVFRASN